MLLSMIAISYLGVLAIIDAKKRELSWWVLASGGVLALLCAGCLLATREVTFDVLLFGAIPGVLLLVLAVLTKGIGIGDGIVLLEVSSLLLLERTLVAFGLSLMIMGAFSAVLLLLKKVKKELRLPYLPFLWIGSVGALFYCG